MLSENAVPAGTRKIIRHGEKEKKDSGESVDKQPGVI